MDPDAHLEEQKRLALKLVDSPGLDEGADRYELELDATRLAELVLALDEWIRKGGFLPTRWRRP